VPGWKRALDLALTLALLPLALPLMVGGAWLVQRRDPGPILFRQERIGHRGQPFVLYKLRTMRAQADQGRHREHLRDLMAGDRPLTKLDQAGDDRVVPGTAWMRRTGIDELPQLFDVLQGHMSLVGPRPCLAYEAEALAAWQQGRFKVPPGLTGLWQVSGKNRTTFRRMLELDVRYANGPSLLGDLGILARTPFAVLTAVGQ
jgi:lipopolysaccharide/colanic/teichoic acid biosynthesis glycosyltransferase